MSGSATTLTLLTLSATSFPVRMNSSAAESGA